MNTYVSLGIVFLFVFVVIVLTLIRIRRIARLSRTSIHQASYARRRLGERIFLSHEVARMSDEEVVAKLAALEWIEGQPAEVKARILSQVNYE